MDRSSLTRMALAAVVMATALGGCTAMRRDRAPETTSLLTRAGHSRSSRPIRRRGRPNCSTLTPYKVVPWKRKTGGTVYAYAEPESIQVRSTWGAPGSTPRFSNY